MNSWPVRLGGGVGLASGAVFLVDLRLQEGTVRLRLAAASFAIFILLALPACKHKESSDNQEKSAAVPATPAAAPAGAPAAPSGTPATPAGAPAAPGADNSAAQPAAPAQPGAAPADAAPVAPQPVIVAAGMKLTVKLSDDLGSKTSQTGQSFSATLDKDVIVDGQTAIPAGASVSGTIVSARPFGKYAGEASLTLKLTSVNINNIDQNIATAPRSFGKPIKAKGKVKKFLGGLVKRAEGDEKEVTLAAQSTYTFTLRKPLTIQ
jgi:hypothetical protein